MHDADGSATTRATAHQPSPGRTVTGWIGLAARLILAVVWIWASVAKLPNLEASVLAVRGYQILPYSVAVVVGYLLPMIELVVGLLLLLGLFTRWAGLVSTLLMLAFVIGISQAWARGLSIDCGCFGGGGQIALEEAQKKYPVDLARDAGLMLLSIWLVWRPRTPFSLDQKLFGEAAYADDPDDHHDVSDDEPADERTQEEEKSR
ncbi:methylamine utilization protein MauE [Propionibacteriaceae bacterium ES.041]|uniref:DoxX family protein n=1 Tax=Enemella evansiae TaxID=2016499 RepID=A0A255G7E5_9ACTN|nr:MauE/DoxX family redox-associated membrane protein [Enemella evansiae]PFG66478.1 methylamine utilization protein MauE [Propionibacteriaceae bacterium ES.041]OYN94392.1 DoxX family protein [Enemella evansiae]OYO04539.1 DoxX family protein [Enemella evansiae]OYO07264.1 DoxX family protein [Enemella evansiae]OYO08774.1 DoxX family protein [Enemella evansiae]